MIKKISEIWAKNKFFFIINVILFIIPWFWFGYGETDFGGDSTRLYFYNPSVWLNNIAVYFTNPLMSLGGDNPNFSMVPFLLFLSLIKKIVFDNGYYLNNVFNGILLCGGFSSLYLIQNELFFEKESEHQKSVFSISALFFLFSPLLIYQWERALYSINQTIIYPLLFLFFLKFINTKKIYFLVLIPILALSFSINFSYATAPWLVAFLTFSFIFFFGYAFIYRKIKIFVGAILLLLIYFFFVFSFDYLIEAYNFISPSGINYQMLFQKELGIDQGLPYFLSVQPHVRLLYNLLNQDQYVITKGFGIPFGELIYNYGINLLPIFVIFPILLVGGFFYSKDRFIGKKIYVFHLLIYIFLISLYLMTAKISRSGLNLYKSFFSIPGFAMFRSFYSKFAFTYVFFYSLLLSASVSSIFFKIKHKMIKSGLILLLLGLIIFNGWPLISGKISNGTLWRSRKIKFATKIDPRYEIFLKEVGIKKDSLKVFSLPLTNENYQILQGENGGVYFGPSSLAVLTGKNSFNGLLGFGPFMDIFKIAVEKNDLNRINDLLSFLNVGYIFHNNDNYIYENFPSHPYNDWLKEYFPSQELIYKFVQNLNPEKLFSYGTYNFYQTRNVLPRFYIANGINYFGGKTNLINEMFEQNNFQIQQANYFEDKKGSLLGNSDISSLIDNLVYGANSRENDLIRMEESVRDEGVFYPDVKKKNNILWWLTLINETLEKRSFSKDKKFVISKLIFFANKRVNETASFKNKESTQLNFYKKDINQILSALNKFTDNPDEKIRLAFKVRDNLEDNLIRLDQHKVENYSEWEIFIQNSLDKLKTALAKFNIQERNFEFNITKEGMYNFYINDAVSGNNKLLNDQVKLADFKLNGKIFTPQTVVLNNNKIFLGTGYFPAGLNSVKVEFNNLTNLLNKDAWKKFVKNSDTIETEEELIKYDLPNAQSYYYQNVANWEANAWYRISGNINISGKAGLLIVEHYKNRDEKTENFIKIDKYHTLKKLSDNIKNGSEWMNFDVGLKSSSDAVSATIILYVEDSSAPEKAILENLNKIEAVNIFDPKITINQTNELGYSNKIYPPKLVFTRINPVKYKVAVSGATTPYILMFTEQFHAGWKIYPDDKLIKNGCGKNSENLSVLIGSVFSNIFVKKAVLKADTKTIPYLNGAVEEQIGDSEFSSVNTSENWSKSSIATQRHFMANGYANSWLIKQEDFCNSPNYSFFLEIEPQRYFHWGLVLSVVSLAAGLLFLTGKIINNIIKNVH